jgi:hypothetical protein
MRWLSRGLIGLRRVPFYLHDLTCELFGTLQRMSSLFLISSSSSIPQLRDALQAVPQALERKPITTMIGCIV